MKFPFQCTAHKSHLSHQGTFVFSRPRKEWIIWKFKSTWREVPGPMGRDRKSHHDLRSAGIDGGERKRRVPRYRASCEFQGPFSPYRRRGGLPKLPPELRQPRSLLVDGGAARRRGGGGADGDFKGDVLNGDARSRPRDGIGVGRTHTHARAQERVLSLCPFAPLPAVSQPTDVTVAARKKPRGQAASRHDGGSPQGGSRLVRRVVSDIHEYSWARARGREGGGRRRAFLGENAASRPAGRPTDGHTCPPDDVSRGADPPPSFSSEKPRSIDSVTRPCVSQPSVLPAAIAEGKIPRPRAPGSGVLRKLSRRPRATSPPVRRRNIPTCIQRSPLRGSRSRVFHRGGEGSRALQSAGGGSVETPTWVRSEIARPPRGGNLAAGRGRGADSRPRLARAPPLLPPPR